MSIFGLLNGKKLNEDKCPFCGQEFRYTDTRFGKRIKVRDASERNVLKVNAAGELEIEKIVTPEETRSSVSYQDMICPKHKYEITRTCTDREEYGKGVDCESVYNVLHYDYKVITYADLSENQKKKLDACCKAASKDIVKTYKPYL